MTDPVPRRLAIWEARHDNGWITLVMSRRTVTFVAWASPNRNGEVDYVEDTPEQALGSLERVVRRPSSPAQIRTLR